jgi:transposase
VNHVAIDLGSKESQVCMRQPDGTIIVERKHPTRRLGEWMQQWSPSRVILETSSEAFSVADAARAAGHEVRVVPATLARQLGVGARGVKTDLRDARQLSEVSRRIELPSVHIPSANARELRDVVRSRQTLVETRTKVVNRVRGWMRTQLWKLRGRGSASLPERLRAYAEQQGRPLPAHIEQVLKVIEALNTEVKAADDAVRAIARTNDVCKLLMTIPGVGPVTAVTYVASVDNVARFPRAYHLQSYLGLTPGENSSAEREIRTSITKASPSSVRRTLIQAAWSAFWHRPTDPMVQWAMQIAQRRGKAIAIVALARKIAGVMYAIWRDGSTYNAAKAAAKREVSLA